MGKEALEDLYELLGLPGGGEACVGVAPVGQIYDACLRLVIETMIDMTDLRACIRSSNLRWAHSVLNDPAARRMYDARLANTIRLRREAAEKMIADAEYRVAKARKQRGLAEEVEEETPSRPVRDEQDQRQLSMEDLERRLSEVRIEEKSLRNGPPRWRRRERG